MNNEQELSELKDLRMRLAWFKLAYLNLKYLNSLRREVDDRIKTLSENVKSDSLPLCLEPAVVEIDITTFYAIRSTCLSLMLSVLMFRVFLGRRG
jgi:hypothetical protein